MGVKRNYTQEENELILYYREQGLSYKKIGDIMNIPQTSITTQAHRLGIKKPTKKEFTQLEEEQICSLYVHYKNLKKVGRIMNCAPISVKRVLDRNNIPHIVDNREALRRYNVNEQYFDNIDSEEKAYYLGLLITDGYLVENGYMVGLTLQDADKHILEKFRECTQNEKPLRFIDMKKKKETYHNQYQFSINSKYMFDKLCDIGVTPKKSLKTYYPTCIPLEFDKAFIRGVLDGDGCICKTNKIFEINILGNLELLKPIQEKILYYTGIEFKIQHSKNTNHLLYKIKLCGKLNCKFFLDWLYNDANIYLNRKYEIYKIKYCDNFTYYGSSLSA